MDTLEIAQSQSRNFLLASMRPMDFALLAPWLKRVSHRSGETLAERGAPIHAVCFPEGAVAASLMVLQDGRRIAIGMTGYEGMVGCTVLNRGGHWPYEVVVRVVDSSALRIETNRLLDACAESRTLHELLLCYAGAFALQVEANGICNLTQPLEARVARWILLCHDRLDDDRIEITHKEIGIMLGIRRASATDVLHLLEGQRAIRNVRGLIEVRDRDLLEQLAGEHYGVAEAEYRRLIGEPRPCRGTPDLQYN